ncbi:hypothetical protein EZS27_009367 [termite gut metagenome]|uniref:Uncharacterized protein n=1 Tax=termite gut metagenome TaxID=433724 RepID=A0A5J4SA28_9ZZZZ
MKFIEVTLITGTKIYINLEFVKIYKIYQYKDSAATRIYIINPDGEICEHDVQEKAEELIAKIRQANCVKLEVK